MLIVVTIIAQDAIPLILPLHRQSIRFSGALLTQTCQTSLPSGQKLAEVAKQDTDPYVGHLPQALLASSLISEEKMLKLLDDLAVYIQDLKLEHNFHKIPEKLDQWKRQSFPPPGFQISFLDGGSFGYVFKIKGNGTQYAFKVLRYREPIEAEEIANGAYFTALQTRDLARFHAGNVEKVWYLAELIDENSRSVSERSGKTLAEHGFTFYDDAPDGKNRVRGIRVDYGSLKLHRPEQKSLGHHFKTVLKGLFGWLCFWERT